MRRECWTLSVTGKFLLLTAMLMIGLAGLRNLYPFLAVNHRTKSDVLLVEGWVPVNTFDQVAAQIKAERSQKVFVLMDVSSEVERLGPKRSYSEYVIRSLVQQGVPRDSVQTIFCPAARRDRTYACAVAARKWFSDSGVPVKSLNVLTVGPHARRSRLLFQKAFGNQVQVGAMVVEALHYDPIHWWRSSEGVREVLFEGVAYLYARFFFSV